jgi:branched-chain amino acid transport system substrate-binding protein
MSGEPEITAGLSISLTGQYSLQGQQTLNGIQLWESYVNAQGGLDLGAAGRRPVRVIYRDDQSRFRLAQQNVRTLLREDRIAILFGPYSSALTLAVAPIAEEHRKILWNHGGTSDQIHDRGFRCIVSVASPASDYLRGLPRWLVKNSPGLHRICILHRVRGSFASQVARGMVEAAGATGFGPVDLLPVNSPPSEPEAIARNLRAINPEVLILAASFQDEVRLTRTRHLWPDSVREIAAVAAGVHAFQRELQEVAEGVIGPSQWEPGVRFPAAQSPDSVWFLRNFRQRFGQVPEYTAAGSFAGGLVLAECVRQAGSLEDNRLREVVAALDLHTFYGRFRIDPATGRQTGHGILLVRWKQGCKVMLEGSEGPEAELPPRLPPLKRPHNRTNT